MQVVIDHLIKQFTVIQLGSAEDIPLEHVLDLRGKTTIRETAAILANARLFLGMEGGLMHLARAVDTRSVIIYTGFITPEYSGYAVNANLFGPVERKDLPCWNREKCYCDCAERVTIPMVINGIDWVLSKLVLDKHWENQ